MARAHYIYYFVCPGGETLFGWTVKWEALHWAREHNLSDEWVLMSKRDGDPDSQGRVLAVTEGEW